MTALEPEDKRDPKRAHAVLLLQMSRTRVKIWITTTGLTRLAKIATRIGKQIGLAGLVRLPGLAQIAALIDKQLRLAGLITQSRKKEVSVMLLTRKAGLRKI
jgi:hypothetical protein